MNAALVAEILEVIRNHPHNIKAAVEAVGPAYSTWLGWIRTGEAALQAFGEEHDLGAFIAPSVADDAEHRSRGREHPDWPAAIPVRDRPFVALAREYIRADAQSQMRVIGKWESCADEKGDWKGWAELAKRRWPADWNEETRIQLSGDPTAPVQVKAVAPAPANPGEIGETIQALLDSNQIEPEVAQAWGVVAAFLAGPVGEPDPGEES